LASPRLNVCLDVPLGQRFLDAKLDRVFPDGRIALCNDDDLAEDIGSLVGERLDDLVVNIVPVLPR
jgi:hypothetical protein